MKCTIFWLDNIVLGKTGKYRIKHQCAGTTRVLKMKFIQSPINWTNNFDLKIEMFNNCPYNQFLVRADTLNYLTVDQKMLVARSTYQVFSIDRILRSYDYFTLHNRYKYLWLGLLGDKLLVNSLYYTFYLHSKSWK